MQLLIVMLFSGVMRITVTVVVIMFELTGALTYILPTMVLGFYLPKYQFQTQIAPDRSPRNQSRRGLPRHKRDRG